MVSLNRRRVEQRGFIKARGESLAPLMIPHYATMGARRGQLSGAGTDRHGMGQQHSAPNMGARRRKLNGAGTNRHGTGRQHSARKI